MTSEAGRSGHRSFRDLLARPVVIVSTPRSGSTLLFETLEQARGIFSTGRESHGLIEQVPGFAPYQRDWSSNRLTAEDATPERVEQLAAAFYRDLHDRDGNAPDGPVRLLEKTPKNALRVPFFDAAFAESAFVYLYRDVRQTLASMMEAWVSGNFRTYPRLPGWTGHPWSLLLVPDWRKLIGEPLPVVVAQQWTTTTNILLDDLAGIPRERLRGVDYRDLVAAPQVTMETLARSLDLEWDRQLGPQLPLSKTTVSRPDADKWRQIGEHIEPVLPIVQEADARARQFVRGLTSSR